MPSLPYQPQTVNKNIFVFNEVFSKTIRECNMYGLLISLHQRKYFYRLPGRKKIFITIRYTENEKIVVIFLTV